MTYFCIAIDGPSGAGKSTMAKKLAAHYGIMHLDTGAMYRALAVACFNMGVDPNDKEAVTALLPKINMKVTFGEDGQRCIVNGEDLTPFIRTPKASMGASDVSKISEVRRWLVALQREMAHSQSFVLDGRDIGTVVLPQADAKFFLTACPEIRARRRLADLQASGASDTFEEVLADVKRRDAQDSGRADSPLRQAEDALLIDSGHMTMNEVLERMIAHLEEKGIKA